MFSGHIVFSGSIVVCFRDVVVFSWVGLVCLGSDVFGVFWCFGGFRAHGKMVLWF